MIIGCYFREDFGFDGAAGGRRAGGVGFGFLPKSSQNVPYGLNAFGPAPYDAGRGAVAFFSIEGQPVLWRQPCQRGLYAGGLFLKGPRGQIAVGKVFRK